MKILFLANLAGHFSDLRDARTIDTQMDCSSLGLSYPLNLLKELSRYADVQIYSPPLLEKVKRPIDEIRTDSHTIVGPVGDVEVVIPKTVDVESLARDVAPDVIIQYADSIFPFLRNFEKAKCLRVLWLINGPGVAADPPMRKFIKDGGADLVIKSLDKSNRLLASRELEDLGAKVVWLPFSVDGERFRNKGLEQIYDGAIIGNLNPHNYLLRVKILEFLLRHPSRLFYRMAFGDQYVDAINKTKVFFTCTGTHRFPIIKFYEVPSCGTLLASDVPIDAEHLGFKSGENYVSLEKAWRPAVALPKYPNVASEWRFDAEEFTETVSRYLDSADEREKIARSGEALVRQRHTDRIRAKELYGMLS